MPDTINFAILGCGHIAVKHAEAIAKIPGARLAALTDIDAERAAKFAARFGGDVCSGLEEILARTDIHAVCVCTPSGLHVSQGTACAGAGKHIVMEKPMALNLEDADHLIDACREHGVMLTVVHPHRFLHPVLRLYEAVQMGRFGRISHAAVTLRWNRDQKYYEEVDWRGTWAQDGGVLFNQAYHILDILLWIMGPVAEATAFNETRLHRIEVPDVTTGIIRFKSGALGVVEATTNVYPRNLEESIHIFGEHGTAAVGGAKLSGITRWSFADLSPEQAAREMEEINAVKPAPGHIHLIAGMVDALQGSGDPAIAPREGRRVLDLIARFGHVLK